VPALPVMENGEPDPKSSGRLYQSKGEAGISLNVISPESADSATFIKFWNPSCACPAFLCPS
jgi:hypothetical protein